MVTGCDRPLVMVMLFIGLVLSQTVLPFDLHELQRDWSFSVAHQSGQFGAESDFHVIGKISSYTMLVNDSVKFKVKSGRALGDPMLHFNLTSNSVEVFAENLSLLAVMDFVAVDTDSLFVRGTTSDGKFAISGVMGLKAPSVITLTSTQDDEVFVIRGTLPAEVTMGQIIARLVPGMSILFFMGFGRIYRKRFWLQFSQMNTRTLQNRLNEAKKK